MKTNQIQQGDVLLNAIQSIPENASMVNQETRIVLARGETTGHAHVINETKSAALYELKGELYLEVSAPVVISHEEHKPLTVPTGVYRVGSVKEYDYFAEMERNVVD